MFSLANFTKHLKKNHTAICFLLEGGKTIIDTYMIKIHTLEYVREQGRLKSRKEDGQIISHHGHGLLLSNKMKPITDIYSNRVESQKHTD